ncbi:MAG: glycosyltransferase family 39 protein [Candidatus Paceibacterota bacterium]|jgi:4-amino-4-deoxy-L-arabinose transferase-like glycosyltransferase
MESIKNMFENRYVRVGSIAVVFLFFLFESTHHLTENPPTWMDEGWYGQAAFNIVDVGQLGVRTSPDLVTSGSRITGGYPYLYPAAVVVKILGKNLLSLRVAAVLFLVAFFWTVFFFSYQLAGFLSALATVVVVSSFPSIFGNGKNFLAEIPGLFYLLLFLYAVYRLETRNTSTHRHYVLAGVALGLAVATKPILLPLIPATLLIFFLRRKTFSKQGMLYALIGFGIAFLLWAVTQFNQTDTFSGVMQYYINPYSLGDLPLIIVQNVRRFVTEYTPAYYMGTLIIWCAAIVTRYYAKKHIRSFELIALVYSILIFLAYLRTPGWYRYLFIALVLHLFFLPVNLTDIAQFISQKFEFSKSLARLIAVILLFGLVAINIKLLWRGSFVALSYNSHKSELLENYIASIPKKSLFLIYNAPEIALFLPDSRNYYQYIHNDGGDIGSDSLLALKEGTPDIVAMHQESYSSTSPLFGKYSHVQLVGSYVFLKK